MIVIGLTGGIATGKSTVSNVLDELGAFIIDADRIAREIVEPGRPALEKIRHNFGIKVLNPDGTLNRGELAKIVFEDKARLNLLNSITHPYIIEEIKLKLDTARLNGEKVAVIDAPLLIETGLYRLADVVWLVVTDELTQIKRLLKRDIGLSRREAHNRISAQMPLKDKIAYATKIIDNSGNLDSTINTVKRLWNELHITFKLQQLQEEIQCHTAVNESPDC